MPAVADAQLHRVARSRRRCTSVYGGTERIGGTAISGREWLEHPGSVGRPASGAKIRILDPETGEELPTGEVGEIYMMPSGGPGSTYRYVGAEARATATAGSRWATWAGSTPTATSTSRIAAAT